MVKLSILVPAYNASRYIMDNIKSVVSQSYNNWELIIVNDGSKDNTAELIQTFIKENPMYDIKLISIPNGGLANARNIAIESSTGDYFCNLDADDFLEQGILKKVADALNGENYDIVYYDIIEYDESNDTKSNYSHQFLKPSYVINGIDAAIMKLKRQIWICQGVAFYRKKYILSVNLFNHPGINQGEDMFFITSALSLARTVKYINFPGASIRFRSDSMMHAPFNDTYLECLDAIDLLNKKIENANIIENKKEELLILIARERIFQELRIAKSICDSWKKKNNYKSTFKLLKKYSYIITPLSDSVKSTLSKSHLLQYYLNRYLPGFFILFTRLYRKLK